MKKYKNVNGQWTDGQTDRCQLVAKTHTGPLGQMS